MLPLQRRSLCGNSQNNRGFINELVYWIWLSLCCRPDSATFPSLLKKFNSAKAVYDATDREISTSLNPRSSDRNLLLRRDLTRASEILAFCEKRKVGILTYADERYPQSLRDIKTPPVLLYYRGVLPDFNTGIRIAIVGTRRLSDYGRKNAFSLAYDLAKSGATVVSGMATGIDGVAHGGALAAGTATIAVIGSGIDVCYPPEHLTLARNIVKDGCVLTEYPPGTAPGRYNFPQRNRIISGLSSSVIVIEGKEKSGAVITARYAKEQGRRVYALPGAVGSENAEAGNLLIKSGASLITKAEDVIKDYSDVRSGGILNPFLLENKLPVSMSDELKRFSVCAVAPTDGIFRTVFKKKEKIDNNIELSENKGRAGTQIPDIQNSEGEREAQVSSSFNSDVLKIYKRIPPTGDCTIESLADESYSMREVMRAILKLEMGRFITVLPGERVKRNI